MGEGLKLDNNRDGDNFSETDVTIGGLTRAGVNVVGALAKVGLIPVIGAVKITGAMLNALSEDPSEYNNRGGRGEHYSDKGNHRERSLFHQPNHSNHK